MQIEMSKMQFLHHIIMIYRKIKISFSFIPSQSTLKDKDRILNDKDIFQKILYYIFSLQILENVKQESLKTYYINYIFIKNSFYKNCDYILFFLGFFFY